MVRSEFDVIDLSVMVGLCLLCETDCGRSVFGLMMNCSRALIRMFD